ncbi:GNAT family N-acetyltransferase [Paenibacillus ginsengarvi]|uniref:GNAT family N-acetyltransferase n=1 Tax=Paenibacillus ginsengarvi TaxID=400777 RepID=A0A3B0B6A4_9BACL|nr:GNAT family N-acetyltransferase [Paenibacillus ginsengarvi]RKN66067.1 GNAT family N-acetyltransferase [Paenibacillus ginsengarvi]
MGHFRIYPDQGSEIVLVTLEEVKEDGLGTLQKLLEFAAYDLSEFNRSKISENGSFIFNLDCRQWFEHSAYELFFIRANEELAGFVVIKRLAEEEVYYLNHFFILRRYRRTGIGKQAAIQAFNRYAGNWRVSEFDWNTPAQSFWRAVVKEYTNDTYREVRRKDNKGPAQEFCNIRLGT